VYAGHLAVLRQFMDGLANCQTVGRNGLHRYNNQDHSMVTAMSAVENMLRGESHDVWSVNTDAEYHEEVKAVRDGPEPPLGDAAAAVVAQLLEKFDPVAMGLAAAAVLGAIIWLATVILVLKGGAVVGPTLALLAEYFPGYRVSAGGSLIGLLYGSALGFLAGWAFARIQNLQPALLLALARRQRELRALARLLE
jgi:hypothetical protein